MNFYAKSRAGTLPTKNEKENENGAPKDAVFNIHPEENFLSG